MAAGSSSQPVAISAADQPRDGGGADGAMTPQAVRKCATTAAAAFHVELFKRALILTNAEVTQKKKELAEVCPPPQFPPPLPVRTHKTGFTG